MRALVVDDERSLVQTVRQVLTAEGFTVDASKDSEDALEHALANRHDLILLGMQSLNGHGPGLLSRLRNSGVSAQILAIIDTENATERVGCLDLGADGYLTRPVDRLELAARVRALRRRSTNHSLVRVHDLEIDTTAHTIRRGGKTISLTRREYALLHFLARHCGQVCSRASIWEHLYGNQVECKSNVVDVFIRFLRAKIDQNFAVPLILTSWGKGYLLRGEGTVKQEPLGA
jgi:DNA-binding response OmpR family regulator